MAKTKKPRSKNSPVLADDFIKDYDLIRKYGMLGLTNRELGMVLGCEEKTVVQKQKKDPKFRQALADGKLDADGKVLRALFTKATGSETVETTVEWTTIVTAGKGKDKVYSPAKLTKAVTKHHPPDTNACQLWLYNRRRDHFKRNWPDDFQLPPDPRRLTEEMDSVTFPSSSGQTQDRKDEV